MKNIKDYLINKIYVVFLVSGRRNDIIRMFNDQSCADEFCSQLNSYNNIAETSIKYKVQEMEVY